MHRQMLKGPPEAMRFVAHGAVHNAGLGNQLQSLTSALLLGILTQRALLVDWPKVDTHNIVYAGNNATEKAGLPRIEDLLQPPGLAWDFWAALNRIPENMRRREVALVEVSNRAANVLEMVACQDLNKAFPQRVIVIKAWDNYLPLLAHNPHYATRMRQMFGEPSYSFRPLAHFTIQPITMIRDQVQAFRHRYFEGKYVLGLQMRSFFMRRHQLATFWQCALFLAQQSKRLFGREVVFFVATDQRSIKVRAKKELAPHSVVFTGGDVTRATEDGVQRALVDVMLLEDCHELIITAGSSFGRLAHGRSGRPPYVVTSAGSCLRQLTSEPCSRLWHTTHNMTCLHKSVHRNPFMVNHDDCDETW